MPPSSLTDTLASVASSLEAVERICTVNSKQYTDFLSRLSKKDGSVTLQSLLPVIDKMAPSVEFQSLFGLCNTPVLLMFAPTALIKAAGLLADPHMDLFSPDSEWRGVGTLLLATHHALMESPNRAAARANALPTPPPLLSPKHTPKWSDILTPSVLADMVAVPPAISLQEDGEWNASHFGVVLYTLTCGLAHMMHIIEARMPEGEVKGAGTLEFMTAATHCLLFPMVVSYGLKENGHQLASASLLLTIRSALAKREAAGEQRQEELMEMWMTAMQCWFDLAVQSQNVPCIQLLFPYILSNS